jgi:tetratricopeptide (TPR) repeat protein
MKKNIKIDKKDLKRNEFAEFLFKIKDYFVTHPEKIKKYVIGIVIGIAVIIIISVSIKNKIKEADNIYSQAFVKYNQKLNNPFSDYDDVIAELKKGYNVFSKTDKSKLMLLDTADAYYRNKNYEMAIEFYNNFISNSDDGLLIRTAETGKMLSYIGLNQYDKALKISEKLLNSDNQFLKSDILVQTALINMELKKYSESEELLNQLIDDEFYKDSQWKRYAEYLKVLNIQKQKGIIDKIDLTIPVKSDEPLMSDTDVLNEFSDTSSVSDTE